MEFRTSLNSAVISLEELDSLLAATWGPCGTSVFIQDSSGLMSITRRGWPVVQSVCEEQPVKNVIIRVLLETVKQVHNEFGDGVKSFVLITSAFLKNLSQLSLRSSCSRIHILQELNKLFNCLSVISVTPRDGNLSHNDKQYFVKATGALFYSSCSLSVSFFLRKTFHDWLNLFMEAFNSKYSRSGNLLCFKYLLRNFSVLCHKNFIGSRSVSDSCVVPGFLINRSAINLYKHKGEEQVKLVFYLPDKDADDIDFEVEVKCLIQQHCSELEHRIMLLTTAVLPDIVLFTLRRKNFIILHGVLYSDAEYISSVLQQSSLNSVVIVQPYVISSQEYTCLKIPDLWQLIIHAPTNSLLQEFTAICKNALKLLLMLEKNQNYVLIPGGGTFEKRLSFFITENMCTRKNTFCPVSSRAELLLWHNERQLAKLRISPTDEFVETNSLGTELNLQTSERSEKEKTGLKEDSGSSGVDESVNSNISDNKSVNAGDLGLILSQMVSSLQNVDSMLLEAFAHSLLVIPRLMKSDSSACDAYEPVALKVGLLQHVLATALRIVKCDMSF